MRERPAAPGHPLRAGAAASGLLPQPFPASARLTLRAEGPGGSHAGGWFPPLSSVAEVRLVVPLLQNWLQCEVALLVAGSEPVILLEMVVTSFSQMHQHRFIRLNFTSLCFHCHLSVILQSQHSFFLFQMSQHY